MVDEKRIASTIHTLLARRKPSSSICPSEVARALTNDEASWRALMPRVREVAKAMRARGVLRITRRGIDLGDDVESGPIRLHRGDQFGGPSDP